jgi:hypothetical protein
LICAANNSIFEALGMLLTGFFIAYLLAKLKTGRSLFAKGSFFFSITLLSKGFTSVL